MLGFSNYSKIGFKRYEKSPDLQYFHSGFYSEDALHR